jgi:plasmid stabilization system protein ParE
MAGELIWSLEALDDIDAIARYIARDSAVHARRVVSEILVPCDGNPRAIP